MRGRGLRRAGGDPTLLRHDRLHPPLGPHGRRNLSGLGLEKNVPHRKKAAAAGDISSRKSCERIRSMRRSRVKAPLAWLLAVLRDARGRAGASRRGRAELGAPRRRRRVHRRAAAGRAGRGAASAARCCRRPRAPSSQSRRGWGRSPKAAFTRSSRVHDRRGQRLGQRELRVADGPCSQLDRPASLIISLIIDPNAAGPGLLEGGALSPDAQRLLAQLELPSADADELLASLDFIPQRRALRQYGRRAPRGQPGEADPAHSGDRSAASEDGQRARSRVAPFASAQGTTPDLTEPDATLEATPRWPGYALLGVAAVATATAVSRGSSAKATSRRTRPRLATPTPSRVATSRGRPRCATGRGPQVRLRYLRRGQGGLSRMISPRKRPPMSPGVCDEADADDGAVLDLGRHRRRKRGRRSRVVALGRRRVPSRRERPRRAPRCRGRQPPHRRTRACSCSCGCERDVATPLARGSRSSSGLRLLVAGARPRADSGSSRPCRARHSVSVHAAALSRATWPTARAWPALRI